MTNENFKNNWAPPAGVDLFAKTFELLSIYFPSVTGILAGSNRSGNLKDPSKSIPVGTLGAHAITSLVYLTFPLVFGFVADRNTLKRLDIIVTAYASWPVKEIVTVGIILSSTGAGL